MPYVRRENGVVAGIYNQPQSFAGEFLSDDDPEIAAFLNPPLPAMDYVQAVSDHIETTAQNRGYDSQDRLASYVLSDVPAWKAEAQAFITWRDLVWAYVFMSQAAVASGQRTQPSLEEFKAGLPQIQWPE